jgi:hypothetical protein
MYQSFKDTGFVEIVTIAGLLHDFFHTGKPDKDSDNLEKAKYEVDLTMRKLDFSDSDIELALDLVEATRYPYQIPSSELISIENGVLKVAMRLCDMSWSNLFPLPLDSMGIHKESARVQSFEDILTGTDKFVEFTRKDFEFLDKKCPEEITYLWRLFNLSFKNK